MKVLIAGYGSIGARHLRIFQEMYPQFEYAVLRRPESNPLNIFGAKTFTQPAEIEGFSPSLVMICNPTYLHADLLEKLTPHLARGTAIFFEKPYAHTLKDLETISKLVQAKEFRAFYGCVLRFHPLLKEAQQLLRKGILGEVTSYEIRCLTYLPNWRPGQDYRNSYSSKREQGGGVLFDLIHEFDYAELFFGPISNVCGELGKLSDLEIDSDDTCDVFATHGELTGRIYLSYAHSNSVRDLIIKGTRGELRGDLETGRMEVFEMDKAPKFFDLSTNNRDVLFQRQIQHMVHAIEKHEWDSKYYEQSLLLNKMLVEFSNEKEIIQKKS